MKRILFFAAALSLGFQAAAQDTLKKVKDSGSITIGHRDASIPFSYYDDKQQVIGYAVELCLRIVDAVKKEVGNPNLKVNYQLVTSANRIPLMANGTIDLECGSTTNNLERQKQVA
ncbi:MAG TPA: transporter substrate-binding domain-containing protein, partial [Burkholderiales bacterium]|nr:transporter substrate-binding domain-containing protein [Burkholderiales bacterium]